MAKANHTSFKKGQSGNPNGRTKGSTSEYRRKFAEIAKLAANDAPVVYQQIRRFMELGESWAFQLYIKDIVPKKSFQPTVQVKTEDGKTRLEAVTAALSGFTELTHEEIIEEVKALRPIETKEELVQQENIFDVIPEELTKQVIEAYNKNKKIDL